MGNQTAARRAGQGQGVWKEESGRKRGSRLKDRG